MATERITNIKLYKSVNLDSSSKHQMTFADLSAQNAYFASKEQLYFEGLSYQRQNMYARVEMNIDQLQDYNYMSFVNPQYGLNKTFYANIVGLSYQGEKVTFVIFKIDPWQTYQFDITILPCFVEREHVADDTIGNYLLDEPVALGDYVTTRSTKVMFEEFYLVIGCTVHFLSTSFPNHPGDLYDGIFSGVTYYITPMDDASLDILKDRFDALAAAGKSDAVVSLYMLPKDIFSREITDLTTMPEVSDKDYTLTAPNNMQLNGYSPSNNKLLTYPYRSLVITNNNGNTINLRYEFFSGNRPQLRYKASAQMLGRIIAYPLNYKGVDVNFDESIHLGDYPQCSWIKDLYANWFATQSVKEGYAKDRMLNNFTYDRLDMAVGVASNLTQNIATANAAGIIGTGVGAAFDVGGMEINHMRSYDNMISSVKEEREIHSIIPNSAQGAIGNAYTNISIGAYGFIMQERTITAETAKTVDDFLTMNGYKVNRVKVPNVTGRKYFNFVKTSGFNCKGNIPNEYKLAIANMFDRGVTFWHGDYVGDYSVDNTIGGGGSITPSQFRLDVVNGTGGGSYNPGTYVNITATDPDGEFSAWEATAGTFTDRFVSPTNYAMPSENATVTWVKKSQVAGTIADLMGADIGSVEWDGVVGAIQTWYYGSYVKAAWCTTSMSYYAYKIGILGNTWFKHENVDSSWNAVLAAFPDRCWRTANYGGTNTMPVRGDAIYFSSQYTTADLTHVGVVSSVSGTSISYISGNTSNPSGGSDGIFEKTLDITNKYVVCFYHIVY